MSSTEQKSQHQPGPNGGSSAALQNAQRFSVRAIHLVLIAITIPLGLGSRIRGLPMPGMVRTYGGDVLSATCIFFGIRYVAHQRNLLRCCAIGFIICVLIELQQLYTGKWLVQLRDDTFLGILLGHGFLWSDIACYAVGTAIGATISFFAESAVSSATHR
jgi:Protein of unknown function (DUF2809)